MRLISLISPLIFYLFYWHWTVLHICDALIPSACAENATLPDAVCCPIPPGDSLPCGGRGRGLCRRVAPFDEVLMDDDRNRGRDDRIAWPSRFFTFLCECQGTYFGYACQECWFGWTGKDCQQKEPPLVRRNVLLMSPSERLIFRNVLSISRSLTSDYVVPVEAKGHNRDPIRSPHFRPATVHEALVFIHYFATRPTLTGKSKCNERIDFNHGGPAFPTWHRYFILLWERALRKIAKEYYDVNNFAVPYWDWTDAKRCVPCTDDLIGNLEASTSKSLFRHWEVYCPSSLSTKHFKKDCTGCEESQKHPVLRRHFKHNHFPTFEHVRATLQRPVYFSLVDMAILPNDRKCKSFARYFEGNCADQIVKFHNFTMHNAIHRMVDGPLNSTRTSPNDPLFLLHHSQMDRLFQVWYRQFPQTEHSIPNMMTPPGHCRQCFLVGFLPAVTHGQLFVDLEALNVKYDSYNFGTNQTSQHYS